MIFAISGTKSLSWCTVHFAQSWDTIPHLCDSSTCFARYGGFHDCASLILHYGTFCPDSVPSPGLQKCATADTHSGNSGNVMHFRGIHEGCVGLSALHSFFDVAAFTAMPHGSLRSRGIVAPPSIDSHDSSMKP